MKRIIKQDLSITLAVLAIAIFAFFFWMYPYHLFHKEQMMLFLYSGEFLRGYFQEEAWLACLTGDFLTQFFYYIGGGPFILSVVLTLFALLTYRTFRQFVSKRYALPLMILLVLWEAGRSCGLAYPLSATLSLIGAEGVFLLYSRSPTSSYLHSRHASLLLVLRVRGMALSGPYAGRRNHSAPSKAKCPARSWYIASSSDPISRYHLVE